MKTIKVLKFLTFLMLFVIQTKAQTIVFETKSVYFSKEDLQYELSKYPKEVLKTYVPQISVVADDRFCGLSRYSDLEISASCSNFRVTIHHELSSMFLNHYDIQVKRGTKNELRQQFEKLNGEFYYKPTKSLQHIDPSSKLANHFYKLMYSTSDFENDFNIISESLFSNGAEVLNFLDSNAEKPVGKKIQLVLDFYQHLDTSFTKSYFRHQRI